ncbi:hypothetical protein SLS58_008856 [Diplodia intermedia]|uniref:BZIP domain-containing protein n=1 Tax=Diplodia intermedia TaxID=856260 RepID=A0ABR3TGH1_9PEZI
MAARPQSRVPDFAVDELPDFASNWDHHLAFSGDTEFRDGLLGMGNQFGDQPDLMPAPNGADFNLLHDASPTSPSVHLQPCFDTPSYAGLSALTQGLREWENTTFDSAAVSPTMDCLPDDLMASCNKFNSEPFNPLLLAGAGGGALTDSAFSEPSSSNSSVGSIPIPQPSGQAFSEYSFCSEPSLAYTGSSFNSDRSFDVLYATHKQNQHLAPPQQNALPTPLQPHVSSWKFSPQLPRPAYVQRARRQTADQPRRTTSSSIGSNTARNALSFIHFRPGGEPGQLLLHGAENSLNGKKPRGRKNPLTPAQKKEAALMRRVKACESCRQRKEKVRYLTLPLHKWIEEDDTQRMY